MWFLQLTFATDIPALTFQITYFIRDFNIFRISFICKRSHYTIWSNMNISVFLYCVLHVVRVLNIIHFIISRQVVTNTTVPYSHCSKVCCWSTRSVCIKPYVLVRVFWWVCSNVNPCITCCTTRNSKV